MADRISSMSVWDTLECDGGSQQAAMPLPFRAEDTFDIEGAERAVFEVDQLDASFSGVLHERIIRLVFDDAEVQEWRIREIELDRGNDNARTAILTCESILFDLIHNSNMLERVEANGQVKNHFELYGLTPTQHVDIILGEAPSYFSKGTIEDIDDTELNWKEGVSFIRKRVDMIYHQDMPLSALVELALVSDLELEITRNGATDYKVNLWQQRGSLADTLVVTHADNLLSARRRTLSSDMATVVYPRGGQDYGSEGSMENHRFLAAEVSGSTVTFHDELFSENDQLNGFYIEDSAGGIIAINDTVAPNQIVLASAPTVTEHSWFTFKRAITTGIGTVYGSLTYLPSPLAQVTYGIKPATLDRSDIPLIDNLVPNPFMQDDAWVGEIPNGFSLIGSPAVGKNTDPLYTRHGGASLHVTCNGAGSGVRADSFRAFMTESSPFLTAQIQLYVVTGQVRLELYDITNSAVFPPTGAEASTIQTAVWIDQFGVAPGGDADDNFFTRGTKLLELRITQIGEVAAEFYLDAVQCAASPSFTDVVYGGRASNDLWLLAKEALETLITPSAEYNVEAIDFDRLGNASYKAVVVGGDVTMTDTEMGINFTTRILRRTRDLLHEGLSQFEVEGKTNDLTRITTQTDRRIRRKLSGGVGYDSERDGDGSLGDGPTDGPTTGGGGGPNLLTSCCEDAEAENCSPDTTGDWTDYPVCDINIADAALVEGQQISWSADVKLAITGAGASFEGEVNAAGTLKKTEHNVLLQDALDTKDNVVDDVGSSSIAGGKLRITGGSRIRFTGFTAAATIVAQIRFGAGLWPWKYGGLLGRLDASGDGYGHRDQSPSEGTHGLLRLDAGVPTMLDTVGVYSVGGGSYPEHYMKVLVADSLQRSHLGGGIGPTWGFNDTDGVHNGMTGTAGFFVESGGQRFVVWDLIVCPSNVVTCSGLPTDYKIEMLGAGQATEVAGTATLDLGSTLMPMATLTVKSDINAVVATLSPASGIYGGNVFVYDSGGALTGDSEFDSQSRIDLEFRDIADALISTATWVDGGRSATYERLSGTAVIPADTAIIRVAQTRVGDAQAIACAQKMVVNSGAIPAQWVPCELVAIGSPAGGAYADALANRQHELIRNWSWAFTAPGWGDYWGTTSWSTAFADASTPTTGQVDFVMDGDEFLGIDQVDDPDTDITKESDAIPLLIPVTPEDVLTIAGKLVKPAGSDKGDLFTDIRYYDINKVFIGPSLPLVGLQWLTDLNDQGRKQAEFYVGDPAHSNFPEDIRYVSFILRPDAKSDNVATYRLGMDWFRVWANLPDLHANVRLELQGDNTVDMIWQSEREIHLIYKAQTTHWPAASDDPTDFSNHLDRDYIWDDGTYTNFNLTFADTQTDILGGALAEGDTCYVAYILGDHNNFETAKSGRVSKVFYLSLTRGAAAGGSDYWQLE